MKAFLLSAIVGVTFSWGAQYAASASADEVAVAAAEVGKTGCSKVIVVKGGEGEKPCCRTGKGPCCVLGKGKGKCKPIDMKGCLKMMAGAEKDGVHVMRVIAGTPGEEAVWVGTPGDRQHVSLMSVGEDEVDVDAGWLGVQLGNMSKVSEGEDDAVSGIAILNVAKGSPAAAAGFERDDILLEIDDVAVGDDLAAMVNLVREATAGERMKYTVLRDGEERTLVAVLGRRADAGKIEWEYDADLHLEVLDEMRSNAKVLRRGEDGEWHFEVIDGEAGITLPKNIGKFFPGMHSRSMQVFGGEGDEKHMTITIMQDGEGMSIETMEDGQIKVTRTDAESGEETVTVYADAEELAAADDDAFVILDGAGEHHVIDLHGGPFGMKTFNIAIGGEDDLETVWIEELEDHIAEQSDTLAEAMDQLRELHIEVKADGEDLDIPAGNTFLRFMHGKAAQTIRENPDGTIDVIVRKGGNELVTRYADEADLEKRNADAFETYTDLKSAGDE